MAGDNMLHIGTTLSVCKLEFVDQGKVSFSHTASDKH